MTQAFLYRWNQKSTGKWYEGSRTKKNCHIDDGYICSSKAVKQMILENPADWERTILVIGSPMYIRDLESTRLQILDARNEPLSYNKHNNDGLHNRLGLLHTAETKNKMAKTRTGKKRPDQSKFMTENNPMKNQNVASKISVMKTKNNPMHNIETRKKLSETRKRLGLSAGANNPSLLPQYQMTCEHCTKTMGKGPYMRWHGDNCKNRPKS